MTTLKTVILPNKEVVEIPTEIDPEKWFINRKSGYVDPACLAPYANQPRTYIDPDKLRELESNIAYQGVRDSIIVTPSCKASWATFHDGDEDKPFLIVSGHRRRGASLKAEVSAVPIEVRIYKDQAAFDDDAETLNNHRQNLSDFEDGLRFRRRIERGVKIKDISEVSEHTNQALWERVHLTYLCPELQKLVAPSLKRRERLGTGFAGALGGLALKRDRMMVGQAKVFDDAYDVEGKLWELDDLRSLPDDLSDDEKRFRLQHAYLNYCNKRGWKGLQSKTFILHGRSPEDNDEDVISDVESHISETPASDHLTLVADEGDDFSESTSTDTALSERPAVRENRTGGASSTGSTKMTPYVMPNDPRKRFVELIKLLGMSGFVTMDQETLDKALEPSQRKDIEDVADILEDLTQKLRTTASTKKRFPYKRFDMEDRPEKKALEELAA